MLPCLLSSALSSRDLIPEAGEDRAGAAREELPELHCVSVAVGTAGVSLCSISTIPRCLSSSGAAASSISKV